MIVMLEPMTKRRFAEAQGLIAASLPQEAIRHGWNTRDLTFDVNRAGEPTWGLTLLGPAQAWSEEVRFFGGEAAALIQVQSAAHGRIYARTPEALDKLVRDWLSVVLPTMPRT